MELCDNHTREQVAPAPMTNNDPNTDVDKVLLMRSVGFGPRGSRAAVERRWVRRRCPRSSSRATSR